MDRFIIMAFLINGINQLTLLVVLAVNQRPGDLPQTMFILRWDPRRYIDYVLCPEFEQGLDD